MYARIKMSAPIRTLVTFGRKQLFLKTKDVYCARSFPTKKSRPSFQLSTKRTLFHARNQNGSENQKLISTSPSLNIKNIDRRFYSSQRVCWKCGRKTSPPSELFFCDCGMVQAPASDLDYFSLFDLKLDFDIDTVILSKMYKDLQKKLHPDKFSQKSEEEQKLANQQSSLINKAYFILLKPLSRGLYMLDYHGYPIEENSGDVDPEFLMEVMEMNENLDEAETHEEVVSIEEEINSLVKSIITDISAAFKSKNFPEAKRLITKYQYYGNMDDKIRERYRKDMK